MRLSWREYQEEGDLTMEWIEPTRSFGMWFDDKEGGWYFVERDSLEDLSEDDVCGSLDKDLLEKIYERIGKILEKGK